MNILKNIFIGLFSALLTAMFLLMGFSFLASAEESENEEPDRDYYSFESVSLGYYFIKEEYHADMNDYFNTRLEKLTDLLDDPKMFTNPEKRKLIDPPPDVNAGNYKEKCEFDEEKGPKNLSTFCTAMGALDIYINYVRQLDEQKGKLPVMDFAAAVITVNEVFNLKEQQDKDIVQEVAKAELVLNSTLNAYNEFRLAYPMHKKYEKIIIDLTKYKLALKKIRLQVDTFPNKFIDATSTVCN